jgi:integrase
MHVARYASGGMRFHHLRHSFATWLVSEGVPINDVQQVMGHERASTTLNMYTHAADEMDSRRRVLGAFAAFSLPLPAITDHSSKDAVAEQVG